MKAAEQGHLDAQCLLIMEYSRFLTNRDYELLKQWLHAKAENGDGRTKFSLGKLYLKLSDYDRHCIGIVLPVVRDMALLIAK